MIQEGKKLGFNNTSLISREISEISSRDDIHILQNFLGNKIKPFIASPMKDVTNAKVIKILEDNHCLGIIHRFQTLDHQIKESSILDYPVCSIGINDDYIDRYITLINKGVTNFCIDVANSSSQNVKEAVLKLLDIEENVKIIVGNVISKEGIEFWNDIEQIVALRVGVAGGSACRTFNCTAMFHPMISLLLECRKSTSKILIADGGIKQPKDACLAIAAGADFIMMGSVFAQCKESPAHIVKIENKAYKIYSGSASFNNQKIYKNTPKYIEGESIALKYEEKSILDIISWFEEGLKSSMSYANAVNLSEFRQNAVICEI